MFSGVKNPWFNFKIDMPHNSPVNIAFDLEQIAINVKYDFLTLLWYCLLPKKSRVPGPL